MRLTDLYVRAVGLRLPPKMQPDIEKEIRSSIEDALEDESARRGRPADEDLLVEVLRKMGPPEKAAAAYLPPRYLIGPELFPHFLDTLRWVLPLVTVLVGLVEGSSLAFSASTAGGLLFALASLLGHIWSALLQAVLLVIGVFALIQWSVPGLDLREKTEWDPREMKTEPDPERISIVGGVFEITAAILFALALILFPEWIGFSQYADGRWVHVSILAPSFSQYLPGIVVCLALAAALAVWRTALGRRTGAMRWGQAVLNLAVIAVASGMLLGAPLLAVSPASVSALGWTISAGTLQQINTSLAVSLRAILGITIALNLVEALGFLYKLVLRDRLP